MLINYKPQVSNINSIW